MSNEMSPKRIKIFNLYPAPICQQYYHIVSISRLIFFKYTGNNFVPTFFLSQCWDEQWKFFNIIYYSIINCPLPSIWQTPKNKKKSVRFADMEYEESENSTEPSEPSEPSEDSEESDEGKRFFVDSTKNKVDSGTGNTI